MPQINAFRTPVAIVVAPLAPAAIFIPLSSGAAWVAAIFSYVVFALAGLPAIAVLRRFGKLNFLSLLLAGAVIGIISLLLFDTLFAASLGSPLSSAFSPLTFAWGAGFGVLVSGSLGLIAGLQNLRAMPIV